MKKIYFILIVLLSSSHLFAQRDLETNEIIDELVGVCRNCNDKEAIVVISCSEDIPLTFVFPHRLPLSESTDTLAGVINHRLKFNTGRGFTIAVHSKNYNPQNLSVPALSPKQVKTYNVKDPDKAIINCYYELTKEGLKLFQDGMYKEAQKRYEAAKSCKEIPVKNDIDVNIARIDSILIWKDLAESYYSISDYLRAILEYQKIYKYNPEDNYVKTRLFEAQYKLNDYCSLSYTTAENYFMQKDFKKAVPLYEQIVSQSCNNASSALLRLQEVANRKQLAHALTYENSNTTVGISTGNYKDYTSSGYFTLRTNGDLFEALRSNNDSLRKPELNVSFGWTIKPVKKKWVPVWIFFGPGYTGTGKFIKKESNSSNQNNTSEDNNSDLKLNIYSAISPEIGILGKIKLGENIGIVARYTFQYRFALKKETEDYIGKTKHVFGIGLCF